MPPTSPISPTLLTLRLSSPSFLETILTTNGCPIYSTETYGSTTSLSRCDPATGLTLIANIHWPEQHRARPSSRGKGRDTSASPSTSAPTSAQLFINGTILSEDDLLKRNCLNTTRKFRIPGHSHALKWRRVQGVFQCTTSAGTPVAVFEPAIITARARLNVFVTTLSGLPSPQPQPQTQEDGVSSILVDYLLVTALLLMTHPEDWQGFSSAPAAAPICALSPPPSRISLPHLDIPASPAHPHPHIVRTPQSRSASGSSPVSPITSSTSEMSTSSLSSLSSWEHGWDRFSTGHGMVSSTESCVSPQRSRSDASLCGGNALAPAELKEIVEYEPPPPYEEIQWTVRVRQPRRVRS